MFFLGIFSLAAGICRLRRWLVWFDTYCYLLKINLPYRMTIVKANNERTGIPQQVLFPMIGRFSFEIVLTQTHSEVS